MCQGSKVRDDTIMLRIIIILHNRTGRKRYGWATDFYVSKDPASWQGVSDNAPAKLAIDIVLCLKNVWSDGC